MSRSPQSLEQLENYFWLKISFRLCLVRRGMAEGNHFFSEDFEIVSSGLDKFISSINKRKNDQNTEKQTEKEKAPAEKEKPKVWNKERFHSYKTQIRGVFYVKF